MASSAPSLTGFDEELQSILATAYGRRGGVDELGAVLSEHFDILIHRDLASEEAATSTLVVAKLNTYLAARGPEHVLSAIKVLYLDLPGDSRLREWVRRHMPEDVQALVPEDSFDRERPAYEKKVRDAWKHQQEMASEGFATLRENSAQVGVAAIVAEFKGQLELAVVQLALMNSFKQLHDWLHVVQTEPFSRFAAMLLEPQLDEQDEAEIASLIDGLQDALPKMNDIVDSLRLAEAPIEKLWPDSFRNAVEEAASQVPPDREVVRTLTRKLRMILNSELSELNTQLINAARKIPFGDLCRLLKRVKERLGPEAKESLDQAIFALGNIVSGLGHAIDLHDRWQDLDHFLVGFELAIPAAVNDRDEREAVQEAWTQTVLPRIEALKKPQPAEWEVIDAAREEFGAALHSPQPDLTDLRRTYLKFVTAFRLRFAVVDRALLNQCKELMPLLPDLKALAEGRS
jgi:hypothetical protein